MAGEGLGQVFEGGTGQGSAQVFGLSKAAATQAALAQGVVAQRAAAQKKSKANKFDPTFGDWGVDVPYFQKLYQTTQEAIRQTGRITPEIENMMHMAEAAAVTQADQKKSANDYLKRAQDAHLKGRISNEELEKAENAYDEYSKIGNPLKRSQSELPTIQLQAEPLNFGTTVNKFYGTPKNYISTTKIEDAEGKTVTRATIDDAAINSQADMLIETPEYKKIIESQFGGDTAKAKGAAIQFIKNQMAQAGVTGIQIDKDYGKGKKEQELLGNRYREINTITDYFNTKDQAFKDEAKTNVGRLIGASHLKGIISKAEFIENYSDDNVQNQDVLKITIDQGVGKTGIQTQNLILSDPATKGVINKLMNAQGGNEKITNEAIDRALSEGDISYNKPIENRSKEHITLRVNLQADDNDPKFKKASVELVGKSHNGKVIASITKGYSGNITVKYTDESELSIDNTDERAVQDFADGILTDNKNKTGEGQTSQFKGVPEGGF